MTDEYVFFDPGSDDYFSLRDGHPAINVCYKTLQRYARQGVVGLDGETVKLRVCRIPYTLGTTLAEFRRFISQCNATTPTECQDCGGH